MSHQGPSLVITILLYIAGAFLIILAVLLLLQAFGVVQSIPTIVYIALLLLAVGSGILYGISSRT